MKNLNVGDRVVVPFPIACGNCFACKRGNVLALRELQPERVDGGEAVGHTPGGLFGYSHLLGGFAGGQAEYARVPFADVGPLKIPDGFTDEQVLFLSDIFPTGYMARRDVQHQAGRHDRGLGLRAGRPVRDRRARTCSAPSASLPSIASQSGSAWRGNKAGATDLINYEVTDVLRHAAWR